jgi:hypothetical protein
VPLVGGRFPALISRPFLFEFGGGQEKNRKTVSLERNRSFHKAWLAGHMPVMPR